MLEKVWVALELEDYNSAVNTMRAETTLSYMHEILVAISSHNPDSSHGLISRGDYVRP